MTSTIIPISERKRVGSFDQLLRLAEEYKLRGKVCRLFADKGRQLRSLIKPIIMKHATDDDGTFRRNWKELSSTEQARLVVSVLRPTPP